MAASTEPTFQITGDGIRYLAGAVDDSQQHTRLGIHSLMSADLGDRSGRLSDLHSAEKGLLGQDPQAASSMVRQALMDVEQLFVRLDVLARGESAVTVMVPSGPEGPPRIIAVPDASCSKRTTPLLAAADGSLGQVSSLLNDIRGLVSEGAHMEAMSDDKMAASQLRIDMLLQAIQRTATSSTADSTV